MKTKIIGIRVNEENFLKYSSLSKEQKLQIKELVSKAIIKLSVNTSTVNTSTVNTSTVNTSTVNSDPLQNKIIKSKKEPDDQEINDFVNSINWDEV